MKLWDRQRHEAITETCHQTPLSATAGVVALEGINQLPRERAGAAPSGMCRDLGKLHGEGAGTAACTGHTARAKHQFAEFCTSHCINRKDCQVGASGLQKSNMPQLH